MNLRPVVRQVARRSLASELVAQARQAGRRALSEPDAKMLLAAFDVPVPDGGLATDAASAVERAEALGYPVALKIVSPDLLHKTEAGGVRLGLGGATAVAQAYGELLAAVRATSPGARIDGVLVERMLPPGRELIVGFARDPLFGPLVMLGLGGIYAEVFRDVVFRLAPIEPLEAAAMLAELRAAPLLRGVRGEPPVDLAALERLLLAVAGRDGLLETLGDDLAELDLNPVIVRPDGLAVADARLVVGAPASTAPPRPATPPRDLAATMRIVFRPASIAVVGASPDSNRLGNRVIRDLLDFGYPGRLYPIHPRADSILGLPAYPSVEALPDEVERAIVVVAAESVPEVIAGCARKGVKVAQIYTAGFGELTAAGRAVERDLLATAGQAGLRLIGPNCIGTYCPAGGLAPLPGVSREPGPIAAASMSGGLTYDIIRRGRVQGLRFSQAISIGNAIDLEPADFLEYFAADPATRIVLLYLETVRDGRRFFELLRATTPRKPVMVLKGGQTAAGGRAAASHTGALAGDQAVWSAALRQAGALAVDSLPELLEAALAFQLLPPPAGPGLALIGPGGGASVLATDTAAWAGLDVPVFGPATLAGLCDLGLPPGTSLVNPLDAPASVLRVDQGRVLGRLLDLVVGDPGVHTLVVHLNLIPILTYGAFEVASGYVMAMVEAVASLRQRTDKPLALALRSSGDPEQEQLVWRERDRALAAGVPVFAELEAAIRAVGRLVEYARLHGRLPPLVASGDQT